MSAAAAAYTQKLNEMGIKQPYASTLFYKIKYAWGALCNGKSNSQEESYDEDANFYEEESAVLQEDIDFLSPEPIAEAGEAPEAVTQDLETEPDHAVFFASYIQ